VQHVGGYVLGEAVMCRTATLVSSATALSHVPRTSSSAMVEPAVTSQVSCATLVTVGSMGT